MEIAQMHWQSSALITSATTIMNSPRHKFVWLKFLLLVVIGIVLLPLPFAFMLICGIVRWISRGLNWLLQWPSKWLFTAFEWCSIKLGFATEREFE